MREGLLQQRLEVVILLAAGVLKLVDHEVVDPRAHPLVDEVHPTVEHACNQVVGVGDEHLVGVQSILLDVVVDAADQRQQAQVHREPFQQLPGIVAANHLNAPLHHIADKCLGRHIFGIVLLLAHLVEAAL